MDSVVKIALGIFFGFLLIFLFRAAYINYALSEAAQQLAESNQKITEENRIRAQLREKEIAAKERKKKNIKKAKQRAKEIKLANAQKKLQAWGLYFQEAEECRSYTTEALLIECANRRIRAKQEFEEKWKQNAL